jgi:hypothetical protein
MLALGLVQHRLRLRRCLLAPFAISFPGGLFAAALGLAALPLLLEFGGGLSGVPLAYLRRRLLGRLGAMSFPLPPLNGGSQVGREIRVLAEAPLDPAGRFSTTPGFDIVAATTSGSSVSLATPW